MPEKQRPDRLAAGLFIAAVLSAIVLSIPALQGQPLALDEHGSYFASGASSVTELVTRSLDVMATPPLSHLLERASLAIFGHSETALRIPSLAGYVLAIVVAFYLGRRLSNPLAGGLTALVLAWHPEVIDEVRIARTYGLELLLATASLWATLWWMDGRPRVGKAVIWALLHAAMIWTHYLAAPVIAVSGALCISHALLADATYRWRRLAFACLMPLAVAALAIPLATSVLRLSEWSDSLNYRREPPHWQELIGPFWMLGAPIAIAVALLIRLVTRKSDSNASPRPQHFLVVLLVWLLPMALLGMAAFSGNNSTLTNVRYRIPLAPASSVLFAAVLIMFAGRRLGPVLGIAALAAGWSLMPHSPLHASRLGEPLDTGWEQAAHDVTDALHSDTAAVFTQTGLTESVLIPAYLGDQRFLEYCACRLGAFYTKSETAIPLPTLWTTNDDLLNWYRDRLRKPNLTEVWLVGESNTDLNRISLVIFHRLVLSEGFREASRSTHADVHVIRFTASPPAASASTATPAGR